MKDKTPKARKVYTFEEAISELKGERALGGRSLLGLSELGADQFAVFQNVWGDLPDDRRAEAIKILREVDADTSEYDFTPIYRLALADKDERVRILAVEGLADDDSPALIEPLIRMLREDSSNYVRAAAATTLGGFMYLGELEELSPERRAKVYSALMGANAAAPRNSVLQQRTLEALGYASNEEVHTMIREAYAAENEETRRSALLAMGRSGDTRAFEAEVVASLKSDSPRIRRAAVWAGGELYVDSAVDELGKLIYDPDEEVRYSAIEALGEIATDDARAHLKRATDSKDTDLAAAAEEALENAEMMGDVRKMLDNIDNLDID